MTPPAPERPLTPDDLQDALGAPTSYGVKLFEINVLQAILTRPVRARLGARDRRHLSTFVITRAGTATGGLLPLSASSCAFSSCSLYSGEHFLLYVFVI